MTRRIVAALVALLLPLADAAQWAGCGRTFGATPASAMETDASMPMGNESAKCTPRGNADQNDHHNRPCGDAPGTRHDCQAAGSCGAAIVAAAVTLAPRITTAAPRGAGWLDQFTLRSRSLRPEPPPPRR